MRVRDIDLWQAPLAFVGQSTSEVRAKLNGAEVPHSLVVDSSAARLAGCRRLTAHDTVPQRPDSGPEPILDLDDVMRDALSDLLQTETQYAPVTDAEGRIAGVLSVEIISEFLTLGGEGRGARRGRAPTGGMSGSGSIASFLAPGRDPRPLRGTDRVADNGAFWLRLGGRQLRPLRHPHT